MTLADHIRQEIAARFLARYNKDRADGHEFGLTYYLADTPPEHQEVIAAEYLAIRGWFGGTVHFDCNDSAVPVPSDLSDVGPYEIIQELGRGGQAIVYLAKDTSLDRQVALKVLTPAHAIDRTRLNRFRREADITSKLEHPGICAVYATGEAGDGIWIAMRYVAGESLATIIAAAKRLGQSDESGVVLAPGDAVREGVTPNSPGCGLSPRPCTQAEIERVLALFEQIARTLHVAHEHGVIHRDIKPGNIMVTEEGDPVILDFGLAQEIAGDEPTLTLTGDTMGTPAYMSPEQLAVKGGRVDQRTDLYSLGVSLYEYLTLSRPFEAPTREGTYTAILTRSAPHARELNPQIPKDLQIVIEIAMEKDRDRRYQTALGLAEDLRRVRMREPIVAKRVSTVVRLTRWVQRNPALALAEAVVFAVLVIGLWVALLLLSQKKAALEEVTTERNEKQAALADYERLGDLSRLQKLVTTAESLWPAHPAKAAEMKAWIAQGLELEKRFAAHQGIVDRLVKSTGLVAPGSSAVASQPTYSPLTGRLPSDAEQFKYDTTAKLVADLTAFVDPDPMKGLLASVKARLAFAESVEHETVETYAFEWAVAIRSIADETECPKYAGLKVGPQLGLIPVGRDPASGLWEFAHLQTGEAAKRRSDGWLVQESPTGLVFVLVPGGNSYMGSQREDPAEDHFDPQSAGNEGPVHVVEVPPFFISKYEMTQGQWLRVTGENPSTYLPGGGAGGKIVTLTHPVEGVSHTRSSELLMRLGLVLPSESEWEYAARGGTETAWSTGSEVETLAGSANLADAFCMKNGGPTDWTYEYWLDDGWGTHSPVGTYACNQFGLHDTIGNVSEVCRDYKVYPGAAIMDRNEELRAVRGGSFASSASEARSANRGGIPKDQTGGDVGIRPVRYID